MQKRLRDLRPSDRPEFLMMPSWFATPAVDSLLFVLSTLEHHGIAYTAHKGLLLGALRLGGMLPWDDDTDVFMIDTSPEDVERRVGSVFREHGFALQFRAQHYYFFAYPRTFAPFAHGGLTELALLTRTAANGVTHFDAHEPRRHLTESELLPARRIPYYGSWIMGPANAEVAVQRMYGELGAAAVMAKFRAPKISDETRAFWQQARPLDGPLDWPRISARFRQRKSSLAFHLSQAPCVAWHLANRAHWLAIDALRASAGLDLNDG